MVNLSRSLDIEFAAKGVTVNAIEPGIVDTPSFQRFAADMQDRPKNTASVKGIGTLDDIANAVDFFVNPLSSYVTGQTLCVCGDRTLLSASV